MSTNVRTPSANPRREQAIRAAGQTLALVRAELATLTPREQAEQAYTPSGPPVDELEDRIRAQRGLTPLQRPKSA